MSRVRALSVFALKAFLNCAFLASLFLGARRLSEKALAAPAHRVDLGAWTILDRPDWVALDDVVGIRDAAELAGRDVSLLDREGLTHVRKRLAASPRVLRVVDLRRVLPNRLVAEFELRTPVAAVEVPREADATQPEERIPFDDATDVAAPGSVETSPDAATAFVEVDVEGVALAVSQPDRPRRSGRPLRRIRGVTTPAPEPGLPFGADVVQAARLSAALDAPVARELSDPFAVIDVTNFGGRRNALGAEVLLRPEPGARTDCIVEWGRLGDDAEDRGEPDFEAKLGRLRRALERFPALRGLRTVKVAFRDLVVVPLPPKPADESVDLSSAGARVR